MKALRDKLPNIIMALGEILVGILLLVNPFRFTAGIITGAGILLVALGAVTVLAYFKADPLEAAKGQQLTKGLSVLLAGIFCIFKSEWFLITFPLLTILYGFGILLTGIAKVQWAVDMFRLKKESWHYAALSAGVTVVVAAVILMDPFATTAVLWTFIAVSLIVEAVVDIVALVFLMKKKGGTISRG